MEWKRREIHKQFWSQYLKRKTTFKNLKIGER